jgi:hypothetical protein
MSEHTTGLLTVLVVSASLTTFATGSRGDEPAQPRKPTAEGVVKLWSPKLQSATEVGLTGG